VFRVSAALRFDGGLLHRRRHSQQSKEQPEKQHEQLLVLMSFFSADGANPGHQLGEHITRRSGRHERTAPPWLALALAGIFLKGRNRTSGKEAVTSFIMYHALPAGRRLFKIAQRR
jgi:hypothetical protein